MLIDRKMSCPQPPQQMPREVVDQLKAAASSNDLNAFATLLDLHLASDAGGGQFSIHYLPYKVISEAVRRDNAAVVAELLRRGMRVGYPSAREAIRAKAKDTLRVFLRSGWDINEPFFERKPTVFAYVPTVFAYVSPSRNIGTLCVPGGAN